LYDKIRENETDGAHSTYGERRDAYRVLLGRPEGKRPLGRPRHRYINTLGTGYLNCLYAYKRKSASPVLNVLKWVFRKWDGGGRAWTGLIWLSIQTGGRLL
jgi:hypothetical protein